MRDLFGEAPEQTSRKSSKKSSTKPWGYACPPGTGPAGKTCRDCVHSYAKRLGKTYYKCLLAKSKWTGGRASDILLRSPACSRFESSSDSSVP